MQYFVFVITPLSKLTLLCYRVHNHYECLKSCISPLFWNLKAHSAFKKEEMVQVYHLVFLLFMALLPLPGAAQGATDYNLPLVPDCNNTPKYKSRKVTPSDCVKCMSSLLASLS
jgi:hypothetical protein